VSVQAIAGQETPAYFWWLVVPIGLVVVVALLELWRALRCRDA
jgi:hypothetical protein